jgi:protein-L-isoaspartate(D-aspartate) O-methyltransferase
VEQLADQGRMVIPLGNQENQTLTLLEKRGEDIRLSEETGVRFVPLLGEFGFRPDQER